MKNNKSHYSKSVYYVLLLITTTTTIFISCTNNTIQSKQVITSINKEIEEIHPGILAGYLSEEEYPNSLELLPPPPVDGSAAQMYDVEISEKYNSLTDTARIELAQKDAILTFPEAFDAFNIILDIPISEEKTPNLYMLLRRSLADAGLATYAAKNNYSRARPFMVNNLPELDYSSEVDLRKDGSYPSGHTAIGWAWELILTEIYPDQTDVIIERGRQYGISRMICNVHWNTDVEAGRFIGSAAVAKLHANKQFQIDLEAAKNEIKVLRNK